MNKPFIVGNVVKTAYRSVVIITKVRENYKNTRTGEEDFYFEWIPIEYSNTEGGSFYKTYSVKESCGCMCEGEDCEDCKGTGYCMIEYKGFDQAEFLAETVKDYILERLTKNFDF